MAKAELVPTKEARKSLVAEMATKYGLEPQKFLETIQKTIFPQDKQVTLEQTAAFLVVANQYDLNPFTREIYAFPGRNGGIVPVVSVDGWATLLARQPKMDGIEFADHIKDGKLVAITCRIYRKDRSKPVEVTEYMSECSRGTEPWNKYPARMLRHKALIQCGRYAFGLTGIVDEDEAERIAETDVRKRIIGGQPKSGYEIEVASEASGVPKADIPASDEEVRQRYRIHELCGKLGYNQARENMLLGTQPNLDALFADLEQDLRATDELGEKRGSGTSEQDGQAVVSGNATVAAVPKQPQPPKVENSKDASFSF